MNSTQCKQQPVAMIHAAFQLANFLALPMLQSSAPHFAAAMNRTQHPNNTISTVTVFSSSLRSLRGNSSNPANGNTKKSILDGTVPIDSDLFVLRNAAEIPAQRQWSASTSEEIGTQLRSVAISIRDKGKAQKDITEQATAMVMIKEEMCLRRVRQDISSTLTAQVFAKTVEGAFAQTKSFMDEIFNAIGAPILETLGYILGLFLLSFVGRSFMDKIVGCMNQMIPGALDLVLVPIISDMTIQSITTGVVYAVCDASVPAIIDVMTTQIMASLTAYLAMTIGPQFQHRISHQVSQAVIREAGHKITHHVVEGLTHSVTHVVMHKVIHQFLCIYCYYHAQYCERCFYYGETTPFMMSPANEPQSYGPLGTSENGALADVYNFATHVIPTIPKVDQYALETEARNEQMQDMRDHPPPGVNNDPKLNGLAATHATD
jgi:hypothetical protein